MTMPTIDEQIAYIESLYVELGDPPEGAAILESLKEFKRIHEASEQMPKQTAKQQYDARSGDSESDPVERLRFFCSLAMSGQDWLDAERFFDAISRFNPPAPPASQRKE